MKKGSNQPIWLTLNEKTTIENANYLFVAESRTTGEKVKFILKAVDNVSPATSRFDCWNIETNSFFANYPIGQYSYKIYEQQDDSNVDENQTGMLVESGLLDIEPESDIQVIKTREQNQIIKVRQA